MSVILVACRTNSIREVIMGACKGGFNVHQSKHNAMLHVRKEGCKHSGTAKPLHTARHGCPGAAEKVQISTSSLNSRPPRCQVRRNLGQLARWQQVLQSPFKMT
eukprot:1156421-Pelagomonas_calceolata.AAC.16